VIEKPVSRRAPGWAALVVVAVLTGMLTSSLLVWQSSHAAFRGSTTNAANSWAAGQVTLSDDDGDTALFTAVDLKPGATGQKCIKVTYGGNVTAAEVRILSAAPTGTLGAHLRLTVAMGTSGGFPACGAFAPSSTPINDVPLSTVGTKTSYAIGYSTSWAANPGESRVFRFTYTLSTSVPDDQQSATCSLPFTWQTEA
jgi:hypothetical protein